MSDNQQYFKKILSELRSLKKEYPNTEVSSHLSLALSEYKNFWGLSDKEFLFILEKYRATLELDENTIDENYVDNIFNKSQTLEDLMDMGDEDDDDEGDDNLSSW